MKRSLKFRSTFVKWLIPLTILLILGWLSWSKKPVVTINETTITVELAFTENSRADGLMYRSKLPTNHGMLFIFPSTRPLSFWMKSTLIPLSIAFIDEDQQIISIQKMTVEPPHKFPIQTYNSPSPARFALEVPQGWFERHEIRVGDKVGFSERVKSAIRKAE